MNESEKRIVKMLVDALESLRPRIEFHAIPHEDGERMEIYYPRFGSDDMRALSAGKAFLERGELLPEPPKPYEAPVWHCPICQKTKADWSEYDSPHWCSPLKQHMRCHGLSKQEIRQAITLAYPVAMVG